MPEAPEANQPWPAETVARAATIEDAAAIARVNVEGWHVAYRGLVPAAYLDAMDAGSRAERWAHLLADAPAGWCAFVAESGRAREVICYASGGGYRTQQDAEPTEDTHGWGELYAIYTLPGAEGRGGGTAVHDALLDHLALAAFRTAALWVLRDNVKAIRWYERRGWRPDGAQSTWSGAGTPLPEIRLVHDLRSRAAGVPTVAEWVSSPRLV